MTVAVQPARRSFLYICSFAVVIQICIFPYLYLLLTFHICTLLSIVGLMTSQPDFEITNGPALSRFNRSLIITTNVHITTHVCCNCVPTFTDMQSWQLVALFRLWMLKIVLIPQFLLTRQCAFKTKTLPTGPLVTFASALTGKENRFMDTVWFSTMLYFNDIR